VRAAVWGAGRVGQALAYRLVTLPCTTELYWTNRRLRRVTSRCVDLSHGLAFMQTCRRVTDVDQERVTPVLRRVDVLVVTQGRAVVEGATRNDVYVANREVLRETVIRHLRAAGDGFRGVVLVVTNPVDLMTRLIHEETDVPAERIIGLGTVVETARLQSALGSHLMPPRPARDVWAYAIGTHDDLFVPVVPAEPGVGIEVERAWLDRRIEAARLEVVQAASRVKIDQGATVHPIVEGVISIISALVEDTQRVLTVSTLDEQSEDRLFYSVPCTLGQRGILHKHLKVLDRPEISERLKRCKDSMRKILQASGDL